jgi:hypothetical protein
MAQKTAREPDTKSLTVVAKPLVETVSDMVKDAQHPVRIKARKINDADR